MADTATVIIVEYSQELPFVAGSNFAIDGSSPEGLKGLISSYRTRCSQWPEGAKVADMISFSNRSQSMAHL